MRIFILVMFTIPGLAQEDIPGQFRTIKSLIPDAGTVAVIVDGKNSAIDEELGQASAENGLKVVKVPIENIRDMAKALNATWGHNPNFIYVENSKVLGGKNSLKFIAKSAAKNGVPVFTSSDNGMDAGAFGLMQKTDLGWKITVNGKVKDSYSVAVPSGDERFLVQN